MQYPKDTTHRAQAISPREFRALATGIGQSAAMSRRTGFARGAKVEASCPADKKHFLSSRGYPTGE